MIKSPVLPTVSERISNISRRLNNRNYGYQSEYRELYDMGLSVSHIASLSNVPVEEVIEVLDSFDTFSKKLRDELLDILESDEWEKDKPWRDSSRSMK